MYLSRRVREITPSPTLGIDARAKQMKRQGIDVISFSVGEPDFDTPEHIKAAAVDAIKVGFTKYTPAAGIPELKEAICAKLKRDNGLTYAPSQILVSVGAKHSLYNALQAVCDTGDEVIIPAPYWVTYPEQVKLAGGVPVVIDCGEDTGFKLTPDALRARITPRTRVLILNSPSNPTGAVYSRRELEDLAEICLKHEIYVLADEVYEKLIYDDTQHVSIASLGPEIGRLTITVNGVSKAYAMTGWRIGYAAAEKEIIDAMADLQGHVTSNPTSIAQKASLAALTGPEEPLRVMLAEFDRRRSYMTERLNRIPGFRAVMPAGAFYVFPNVSGLFGRKVGGTVVTDADSLAAVLLDKAKVALVPGGGFGAPDNIRFSYATSMDLIVEGLDRIETLVQG